MTSEEISKFQALSGVLAMNGGFKIQTDNPLYAINQNQLADGFEKMFKSNYYTMAPDVLKAKMITGLISASRTKAKELLKQDPLIKERIDNLGLKGIVTDAKNDQLIQ